MLLKTSLRSIGISLKGLELLLVVHIISVIGFYMLPKPDLKVFTY